MAAGDVRIRYKGIRELLTGPEVAADLRRRAEAIAAAAGPGHKIDVTQRGRRARAAVITDTLDAMKAEAKRRTLTRALDAGRQ